jgi:hypothetical protein
MGIRSYDYMIGTQFQPEADAGRHEHVPANMKKRKKQ